MGERQVNERLATLLEEAGLSHKALARAVRDASARRGRPIGCDHTAVSRWLHGMRPRGETPELIAEVLGTRLRRTVSTADIGFGKRGIEPDLGLAYGDDPAAAASALADLVKADLADEKRLHVVSGDAATAAALSWLVRPGSDVVEERPAGTRVGLAEVKAIRATVEMFGRLDNDFGGGHARRAFIQYLDSHVTGLLGGRYTETTGRQLYAAAAEASLLAAWSSYDAGHHGLAQRYFVQALRLAQAGEDVLLAGSVLDAMSHQATFLGRWQEAATLARAARQGTAGRATPTLTSHFHAMEARALAAGGQLVPAQQALSEAVRVFERRQPGADPDWISYFDDAELSAEFGHCFRDLGRARDAVTYAERALAAAGASGRSDFFVRLVRAEGLAAVGEIEAACDAVRDALDDGEQLKSARCAAYLRHFRRRRAGATCAALAELEEYASEHPLWVAARLPS